MIEQLQAFAHERSDLGSFPPIPTRDELQRTMNKLLEIARLPFIAVITEDVEHRWRFRVHLAPWYERGDREDWRDLVPEVLAFAWRDFEILRPLGVMASYSIVGDR